MADKPVQHVSPVPFHQADCHDKACPLGDYRSQRNALNIHAKANDKGDIESKIQQINNKQMCHT